MKAKNMWMVRAGGGAKRIDDFSEHGVVAIGWNDLGKIEVGETREDIAARVADVWLNASKSKIAISVGQIFRFLNEIWKGDDVVSYSPAGSDRGKDIIASPDGFGFEQPRIVVEVKHRPNAAMDSQATRSFIGGRHKDDKGLYVSTGGFTKDARYEADRGAIPVVLLDLDDLAKEILGHYGDMDMEARSLIPLTKIYWPT